MELSIKRAVGAAQQTVLGNVGADDDAHADLLHGCNKFRAADGGGIEPTVCSHHAVAQICTNSDPVAKACNRLAQKCGIGQSGCAENDTKRTCVKIFLNRFDIADTTADLNVQGSALDDIGNCFKVGCAAVTRALQVHHVQVRRACALKALGNLCGIVVINGHLCIIAPDQANGLAVDQVNGGK